MQCHFSIFIQLSVSEILRFKFDWALIFKTKIQCDPNIVGMLTLKNTQEHNKRKHKTSRGMNTKGLNNGMKY